MSNTSILFQNQTASNYLPSEIVWGMKVGMKTNPHGFYGPNFNATGLSLLLLAPLSSSTLFSLYDLGMDYKHARATTISAKIDFREAVASKKRISAKEARRLVLLDLEEAETRRRQYAEELARFQLERLELGD